MAGALYGKRIMITRASRQAGPFVRRVEERGGIPIRVPVVSFRKYTDNQLEDSVNQLESFDWVVFTSANGVRYFLEHLREKNQSIPGGTRIAVVGKQTKHELESFGYKANVVPDAYIAGSLVDRLLDVTAAGDRVLFLRGNLAKNTVVSGLKRFGLDVSDPIVYETILNDRYQDKLVKYLREKRVDVITFTSSSTVNYFVQLLEANKEGRALLNGVHFACIGPVTADTLKSHQLQPDIVAEQYSVDGLLQAIETFFGE